MECGVRVEVVRDRGALILDRPKALNALNLEMIRRMRDALSAFATDPKISFVTISSSVSHVFCAGGDLRIIRQQSSDGNYEDAKAFFSEEYELNKVIANFPKPYVSLIEGICMGGGLGLTVHGSHRFVAPDLTIAMPEGAIGFFVDVGASYFLNRLEGSLGMYLALTGARLDGYNALYAGLATSCVEAPLLAQMKELTPDGNKAVCSAMETLAISDVPCELADQRKQIDYCFSGKSVSEIIARLGDVKSEWSQTALNAVRAASPTSTHISHSLLTRTRGATLEECLSLELEIALMVIKSPDFFEGTRAMLIDKDRRTKWTSLSTAIFDAAIRETVLL